MKSFIWTLTYPTRDYLEALTEKVADINALRLITALENPDGDIEECRITFNQELSAEELVNFGSLLGIFDVEYAVKIEKLKQQKAEYPEKKSFVDFLRIFESMVLKDRIDALAGKIEEKITSEKEEKAVSEERVKDEAPDNQEEEEDLAPIFQMHVVEVSDIDGEMSFSAKEVTAENVDEMPDSQVRILLKDLLRNFKK